MANDETLNLKVANAFHRAAMLSEIDPILSDLESSPVFCEAFIEWGELTRESMSQAGLAMINALATNADTLPNGEPFHEHTTCVLMNCLAIAFIAGMEYHDE